MAALAALAMASPAFGANDQFAREAWAHFSQRCKNEAGEKIYETHPHVNSVIVLKPLPPASEKDLHDQYWYGDPYSNATPSQDRAERVASTLLGSVEFVAGRRQAGFDFVEMLAGEASEKEFVRLTATTDRRSITRRPTRTHASRFAVVWEDISTPEDRKYWVAASRLRIIDLLTENLVAERVGFVIEPGFGSKENQRRPWLAARQPKTTCPAIADGTYEDRGFVLSVLKPEDD